jgi:O-antigen/teichoic acid export membrane protein
MYNSSKFFFKKIGLDITVAYALMARGMQAIGVLLSAFLISMFLTKEEQGYYYTFMSIIALQFLFELGLNSIITQYVAHELVHLHWSSKNVLEGSEIYLSRVASLLHFFIKLFSVLAVVLCVILQIMGFYFFSTYKYSTTISWQSPWLIVSIATALMLWISPVLAFLEGLGRVKEVAKIRFFQQLVNLLVVTAVFIFKGKLFAIGIASLFSFFLILIYVWISQKNILLFIYNKKKEWKVNYFKEIFPYQYKIALSFISGYFVFQLFNPVLFVYEGPVVAGQMGMSLTVLTGILALAMSWINTKVPLFSSLIAKKNYKELDEIFNKTAKQSALVNGLMLAIAVVTIFVLKFLKLSFAERVLDFFPFLLLAIVTFVNQIAFCWATYLRCHKQEPLMLQSVVSAVLCSTSAFALGKYFGLMGVVLGYAVIMITINFSWVYSIFIAKRKEWHAINYFN